MDDEIKEESRINSEKKEEEEEEEEVKSTAGDLNETTTFRVCVNKSKSIIIDETETTSPTTSSNASSNHFEDTASNPTLSHDDAVKATTTLLTTATQKKRRFLFNQLDDSDDETQNMNDHESDSDSKRIKSEEPLPTVNPIPAGAEHEDAGEEEEEEEIPTPSSSSSSSNSRIARIDKTKRSETNAADKAKEEAETMKKYDTSDLNYWKKVYLDKSKENRMSFKDLLNREIGQIKPREFQNKAYNSLDHLRRMKLTKTLTFHEGCVNALNFNRIGTLLCSGSDDYRVCIYDWARSKAILSFDSGHKSNVFQTKFIPFTGDTQIATAARDGQVRLALISSSGSYIGSKRVAKHADSCHKLAMEYDCSNIFLSCGEDSVVYEIDLRQETPARIVNVKCNRNLKLPLYSISSNPVDSNQFAVSGRDQYIRLYDKRMLVEEKSKVLKKFYPHKLEKPERVSITSAVYNYNGSEIVASYSDDDIYLYNALSEDGSDAIHRYKGHRNSDTIKGVNFYGADSSYVVSGSDCGRIFFWDKETEQIVQTMKGDENGVVNVLEPHPSFPVLATSGLDYDVKLWTPIADELNELKDLPEIIKENQRNRDSGRHFSLSTFEFELLLLLMHRPDNPSSFSARLRRLRRSNRGSDGGNNDTNRNTDNNNNNNNNEESSSSSSSSSDDDDDDEDEDEDDDENEIDMDDEENEEDEIDYEDEDDDDALDYDDELDSSDIFQVYSSSNNNNNEELNSTNEISIATAAAAAVLPSTTDTLTESESYGILRDHDDQNNVNTENQLDSTRDEH